MRLVPNSFGALREYNRNHEPKGSPKGGRFARNTGGDRTYVDEHGLTHVGGFIELYHGTSASRAAKIQKEGFRLRAVPHQTMGGDPESSRNYVWFAKRSDSARRYSEMHARPVVVTIRVPEAWLKELDPYQRNSGPDSVWINQAIPAKYVHSVSQTTREANPCHNPADGQFAVKGQGRCLGVEARRQARIEHSRRERVLKSHQPVHDRFRDAEIAAATRRDAISGKPAGYTHNMNVQRIAQLPEGVGSPAWIDALPGYLRKDARDAWRADRAVLNVRHSITQWDPFSDSPGVADPKKKIATVATHASSVPSLHNGRPVLGKDEVLSIARHELGHLDQTPLSRTGGEKLAGLTVSKGYQEEIRAWKNAIRNSRGRVDFGLMRNALLTYARNELFSAVRGEVAAAEMADRHAAALRRYARRVARASRKAA